MDAVPLRGSLDCQRASAPLEEGEFCIPLEQVRLCHYKSFEKYAILFQCVKITNWSQWHISPASFTDVRFSVNSALIEKEDKMAELGKGLTAGKVASNVQKKLTRAQEKVREETVHSMRVHSRKRK